MEIISRADAINRGLRRYFTGKPCKNGHISEFQVSNYSCCECQRSQKLERYRANPEEYLQKLRDYRSKHLDQTRAINKRSRERNRDSILAGKKRWYAKVSSSQEWKDRLVAKRADQKGIKASYDKKYRSTNRDRVLFNARRWAKENPDKRRDITHAYDSRRRSQKKDGDSTATIRAWRNAASKVCHWCSKGCANDYHIDHYIPLSKGGKHEVSNLVISCPSCNLRKNAKDPYEFASSIGRLF